MCRGDGNLVWISIRLFSLNLNIINDFIASFISVIYLLFFVVELFVIVLKRAKQKNMFKLDLSLMTPFQETIFAVHFLSNINHIYSLVQCLINIIFLISYNRFYFESSNGQLCRSKK